MGWLHSAGVRLPLAETLERDHDQQDSNWRWSNSQMSEYVALLRYQSAVARYGLCRHCQERPAYRSRGLCSACYPVLGIRRQYPSRRRQSSIVDDDDPERELTCGEDELPCMICDTAVKVKPHMRAWALRLRCAWSLCDKCKEKAREKA